MIHCFNCITKQDDSLVKFYTGFPCYSTLLAYFEEILKHDTLLMRQWCGRRKASDYGDIKSGVFLQSSFRRTTFFDIG